MKNIKFTLILAIVSINCLGQINFKIGYYINNEDEKIECFIKDMDWLRNPAEFQYKLTDAGEIKTINIKDVKEFSILESSKYIRADVNIDSSSSLLDELSMVKDPLWKRERLFLNVLVEGEVSLLYFRGKGLDRFFYSYGDTAIKQLVYKEYLLDIDKTAFNNSFRQQLFNDVNCSNTTINSLKNIDYNMKDLTKYFLSYNACVNPAYVAVDRKHYKSIANLNISAGFDYSSLSVFNTMYSHVNTNFNNELNYRFETNVEWTLPINKNKWGVTVGPTYQAYKSQKHTRDVYSVVDFKSIDLSLGVKHYFYLNKNSKFFIDFYFNSLVGFTLNSKMGFQSWYSGRMVYYEINKRPVYIAYGGGFEYKKVYAGIRSFSSQEFLPGYTYWYSNYRKISFVIGYKIVMTRHSK